jgi:tryptophan-rich sensory protein
MLELILLIIKIITAIVALVGATAIAFSAVARVVESIYQLSQTPNLNTFGKIIQVVKNFFVIEKYEKTT